MSDLSDPAQRRSRLSPAKQALLERRLQGKRDAQASPQTIPRDPERAIVPLSFGQERLWFLDRYSPGNPVYNSSVICRLRGPLDEAALERSLNEIVRRHEMLRTTFCATDGRPLQMIAPSLTLPLPVIDLGALPDGEGEAEALRLAADEVQLPFDLEKGPLLRATLFRLGEQEHIFSLVIHHIVNDAWSRTVLFRELGTLYAAFTRGEPSLLPELPIQYADYAIWQRERLQGRVLEQQTAYWTQQLDGAAALELPADHPRPTILTYQGAAQTMELSTSLTGAVQALGQQQGATPFMVLLAAFKVLLHRYTGQDDIVVGAPTAGRTRPEVEGLVGFFVNSLVLRTDLSGNPTFLELVEKVRGVALEALAHQDLPFEKLLEESRVERDPSRTPLFQVFFNMLNVESLEHALPGAVVERLMLPEVKSNFDLTVYAWESDGRIRFRFLYRSDLFTSDRMREMMAQYQHLLVQMVGTPDHRISEFTLVTPSAEKVLPDPKRALSAEWRGAIHARVAQHARQAPHQLALVDPQEIWTYQELDQRSNQLANCLIGNGIRRRDVVAIHGHRSASVVWAVLGILKAGAAFLILDPAYPDSRLIRYLSLAQPRGWIHLEAAGALPETLTEYLSASSCCCRLALPGRSAAAKRALLAGYSDQDPQVPIGPDDLACVVFTSGTTGKPKGILGRHGSLTHFEPWRQELCGLTEGDRFAMLSALAYSVVQRDIFTPLWLGATLFIPDDETIGTPGQLAAWMAEHKITFAGLTPAMGQILAETAPPDFCLPALRNAFFVGDRLSRRDVVHLRRLAPNVTCINTYGTTETQRADSYFVALQEPEGNAVSSLYPLGQGMPDVQLLVLNGAGKSAGVGELGEIYVRSPHLALGYLGDETLTRARFITNPFTSRDDDRLYRTGDLGRYLPDGRVEFCGRADRQVKVRGFRIEPSEIETALEQHPAVRQAIVMARDDLPGGRGLVAYLVVSQETMPTTKALRTYAGERLPVHMTPAAFVFLNALPLTPNGKVDLRALAELGEEDRTAKEAFAAPRDHLERQLVHIWEGVLGVHPVGIGDNFFDLGGNSLLGIRLFARIEKELGKRFPVALLFQSPIIERLAQALRGDAASPDWSTLVRIQGGGSRPPFFCVHGFGGGVLGYAELARLVGPDQPFYGLVARGINGREEPDARIEDMAAHYVRAVRTLQPEGPYYLGGYCYGGVVAFEMARQLRAQGQQVALLAVLEGYALRRSEAIRQLWRPRVAARFVLNLPYWLRDALRQPRARQKLLARLRSKPRGDAERRAWDAHVERVAAANFGDGPDIPASYRSLMAAHLQAMRDYNPPPYPGRVTLFRVQALSLTRSYDPEMGWAKLAAGGVEVRMVAGAHYNMLERPHVEVLAARLRESLDRAQEQ